MPGAHRQGDSRQCGATTIVGGQTTVFANDKLWAVDGDSCTHGGGNLIHTGTTVYNEDKLVIVNTADKTTTACVSPLHLPPTINQTASGSGDVFAY